MGIILKSLNSSIYPIFSHRTYIYFFLAEHHCLYPEIVLRSSYQNYVVFEYLFHSNYVGTVLNFKYRHQLSYRHHALPNTSPKTALCCPLIKLCFQSFLEFFGFVF